MSLLPVETALDRVLEGVMPLAGERVPLAMAGGRILAEPIAALRSQPAFDASATDGYAFRSADTRAGARLRLVTANGERTTYLRATLMEDASGLPRATPLPAQDLALLGVLAEADCLLIRSAHAGPSAAGATCSIIRL